MHSIVVKVVVIEDQAVVAGNTFSELEAMKMEQPVVADTSGTVESVHISVGEVVEGGQLLVRITPGD